MLVHSCRQEASFVPLARKHPLVPASLDDNASSNAPVSMAVHQLQLIQSADGAPDCENEVVEEGFEDDNLARASSSAKMGASPSHLDTQVSSPLGRRCEGGNLNSTHGVARASAGEAMQTDALRLSLIHI